MVNGMESFRLPKPLYSISIEEKKAMKEKEGWKRRKAMVDKEDEEKENDGKKKAESIRLPTAPAQGAVKSGGLWGGHRYLAKT